MVVFLILVILAALLLVNYVIANEFYSIAKDKGYHENRYFLFCFLLGFVGYIMVCALPDRSESVYAHQQSNSFTNSVPTPPATNYIKPQAPVTNPTRNAPTPPQVGTWTCGKCGASNSTNYSQCKKCGSFRQ